MASTDFTREVPGGAGWSLVLPQGAGLTLEALADHACVSTLLYAAGNPLERLNIPDTLKAQMSACVRPPLVLMSDLGYARHGNDWRRSARALLLDELATLGLDRRDLHATVNWFVKVAPDLDGTLTWQAQSKAGDRVALRAEQDLLVVLATAPHPLDPAASWAPAGVRCSVSTVDPPGPDDPSRLFRAESARALAAVSR